MYKVTGYSTLLVDSILILIFLHSLIFKPKVLVSVRPS